MSPGGHSVGPRNERPRRASGVEQEARNRETKWYVNPSDRYACTNGESRATSSVTLADYGTHTNNGVPALVCPALALDANQSQLAGTEWSTPLPGSLSGAFFVRLYPHGGPVQVIDVCLQNHTI